MNESVTLSIETRVTDKGTSLLSVTATATGMSSKIFAIERLPVSADSSAPCTRFSHVCSPGELNSMPETPEGLDSYFRTGCVEFVFDTMDPIGPVVSHIKEDVARLVGELRALSLAEPSVEMVEIG